MERLSGIAEQNTLEDFLSIQSEAQWEELLNELIPFVHPVDQEATRIWFSFWPLKLSRILHGSPDPTPTIKRLQLDGRYRLDQQIDSSISFFYAACYWEIVKQAILDASVSKRFPEGVTLLETVRTISEQVAAFCRAPESITLGITAAGVMMVRQVGIKSFETHVKRDSKIKEPLPVERVLSARKVQESGGGISRLFGIRNKKHRVHFEEGKSEQSFVAMQGQDLSMASELDKRNFRHQDQRRIYGPIPAECRSGACGYCWIGVISGKENLSELTAFEQKRLVYFGYHEKPAPVGSHPNVRLACQSKCHGSVHIVIPPWNGVLNSRRSRLQEEASQNPEPTNSDNGKSS
ncbi:MAG: 2Fe-2S iron-sulfur cluster-binding protein [Terriglobia bacterium]